MNKYSLMAVWACLFLTAMAANDAATDADFAALRTELNRNFETLSAQPVPAYYAFVRLDEQRAFYAGANGGRLLQETPAAAPTRILTACLRVGDYALDNSHELREAGWSMPTGAAVRGNLLPYEPNDFLLRNSIRLQLDKLYKEALQTYEQVKANLAAKVKQEDTSPDFSREAVDNRYEAPVDWNALAIDPQAWEEKLRRYSAVFDAAADYQEGAAYVSISLIRTLFVDTEGREMAQNNLSFQLMLAAHTTADDGMTLPLSHSWYAASANELPSDEEVLQMARGLSEKLTELRQAPVVESFTGPAILSPEAAGVFFHEIFGHRIEGSRLKQENDAQTFKKQLGESVLPKHLSVTFDPTLSHFGDQALSGYYTFDDEGIPAQRVEIVKNGRLQNFLMSRTCIEGQLHSNGHGRGAVGNSPVSRQSNMLIQSTQRFSDDELRKRLRKEARAQKKPYSYYFKEVAGGFTHTSRLTPNAFNVVPLLVYRVYTDGRPDELVRGVDMVGTPLAMFSQIAACGEQYAVFNGVCGAESGSVPVACVAPALLVRQIETQKRAKSQTPPILLPKPADEATDSHLPPDSIVMNAIRKEVERGLSDLKREGLQSPFFISYLMGDRRQTWVSASHGSLTHSDRNRARTSNARLLMGDYECTDENFQGSTDSASGYDGTPVVDNDERGIRYTVWKDLDALYKSASEVYEQKLATIRQLNLPPEALALPDWDRTPVVRPAPFPARNFDLDPAHYESYVKQASALFNDYPEIWSSDVALQLIDTRIYFYNTEGTAYVYPLSFVYLQVSAVGQTDDGEDLSDNFQRFFSSPDSLPPIDSLQAECRRLALRLREGLNAPKLKDAYAGPVLFEGPAVSDLFFSAFFRNSELSLIAQRKPLTPSGFSYGGNDIEEMMGKRITAREITIEDLTGSPTYSDMPLPGYAPIDAQGVVPLPRLPLVENGILTALLNDRVPTPKAPHSTGHALLGPSLGSAVRPGVIRLSDTRMQAASSLKALLLERARQEGYEYAYIVRETFGMYPQQLYRVAVADGTETRVRSAEIVGGEDQLFKRIIAVSDQELIYNDLLDGVLTLITPNAILFDDVRIQSDRVDNFTKPPLVPGHLSQTTKSNE